ncbi:TIGR04222 domain-containing membrane protein [Saccharothrix xinjiangensis]|uniref:TIGR04222 domain-containing membrane protein n=1 Tax=Saccharothrix xinjiangensis TaxID=204798 RepID=UPI0031E36EE9
MRRWRQQLRRRWGRLRRRWRLLSRWVAVVGFPWWYGAALVVAVVVGLRLKRVTGAAPGRVLGFEEVGYLGGGPVRAVEVAVAGLVADNRARVSGSTVTAVPPADPGEGRPATALRAAVLTRLPQAFDDPVVEVATSAPARRIGARLVAEGLLVAPRHRLARAALAALPLALLAVAAVLAGPGGWATGAASAVTGALAVLLLLGPPPVLTRHGARAFARATEGLAPVDPAEVTARYGLPRTTSPPAPHEGSARTGRFGSAPDEGFDTVFNGRHAEPITHPAASDAPRPRRSRARAASAEPRRWSRRNGWLVAGGWFAGGWLAGEYLTGDGWEGDDGGGFVDPGSGGFDGGGGFGA